MFPEKLPCRENCIFEYRCGSRLIMDQSECKKGLRPLTEEILVLRKTIAIHYKGSLDVITGFITDNPRKFPIIYLLAYSGTTWTEIVKICRGMVLTPPSEIERVINTTNPRLSRHNLTPV